MKQIEKKILPSFYAAVRSGAKTFELRKDEDDAQPGDILVLREWDGVAYTGHKLTREVSYVLRSFHGLEDGYCVIGMVRPGQNDQATAPAVCRTTAQLVTKAMFEDNPLVDGEGFLPAWVECDEEERKSAVRHGIIESADECIDGWTTCQAKELEDEHTRYWTTRPSARQMADTPWPVKGSKSHDEA